MKDTLLTAGAVVLAVACCLLPLVLLGGISVVSGLVLREIALILVGAVVILFAVGRAIVWVRRSQARKLE